MGFLFRWVDPPRTHDALESLTPGGAPFLSPIFPVVSLAAEPWPPSRAVASGFPGSHFEEVPSALHGPLVSRRRRPIQQVSPASVQRIPSDLLSFDEEASGGSVRAGLALWYC